MSRTRSLSAIVGDSSMSKWIWLPVPLMRYSRLLRLLIIDQIYRYMCSLVSSGIVIWRRYVLMTTWNIELTALIVSSYLLDYSAKVSIVSILCKCWRNEVRLRRTCRAFLDTKLRASPRLLHGVFSQSRLSEPPAFSKQYVAEIDTGVCEWPVLQAHALLHPTVREQIGNNPRI